MKQWMLICLLITSAAAFAETPATDAARSEAEEAKTRAKLEEARARLDKAAREVAELSDQLGTRVRRDVRFTTGGPPRAVVWLYDVEGWSHEEIAKAFDRTLSFSKSQLARGHARLRDDLVPPAKSGIGIPLRSEFDGH